MYVCKLGYRHSNGEVEGFLGSSLTSKEIAEQDCLSQMRRKCELMTITPQPFSLERVIRDDFNLTKEEAAQIRADWRINLRY